MNAYSRRLFLKQMGIVGAAGMLSFGSGLSFAQSLCTTRRKILVVVNLLGGLHGLSLLPPRQLQEYYDKHPTVGIKNPLALTPAVGLHPAMTNLHKIFGGELPGVGAVFFNQVGFLNPAGLDVNSRSHEVATNQYAAASVDPYSPGNNSGWLGRYAALHCAGPSAAYSLVNMGGVARTFLGQGIAPVSAASLAEMVYADDSYSTGLVTGGNSAAANRHVRHTINELLAASEDDSSGHQELYRITHEKADSAIDMLAAVRTAYAAPPAGTYVQGNPLNQRFMDSVALINSWDRTKVTLITLAQGGYDTHANQRNDDLVNGGFVGLARSLLQLDQAIGGFFNDLKNRNLLDNVVMLVVSEFGRTFENGNRDASGTLIAGTDHGSGAPAVVIGKGVRRALGYLNYQGNLFTDNRLMWLKTEVDVRSIYATLLEQHLGVSSAPLFTEPYVRTPLQIFA